MYCLVLSEAELVKLGDGGLPRLTRELTLKVIEERKVTHAQFVPTMFVRMLKLPQEVRERYDLSSLMLAVHAAAPCPIPVKEAMIDWLGPKVLGP